MAYSADGLLNMRRRAIRRASGDDYIVGLIISASILDVAVMQLDLLGMLYMTILSPPEDARADDGFCRPLTRRKTKILSGL